MQSSINLYSAGLLSLEVVSCSRRNCTLDASIAQLGERQTEDLKVPGSIPGGGIFCCM